jgi:hypothetical protein
VSHFLREVEEKYDVSNIRVDGEQAWPYLRIAYATSYLFKGRRVRRKPSRTSVGSALSSIGKLFYGFGGWFRQYDYVVFSTSRKNVRKRIEGKYFDRFADPLIDELGRDETLLIEDPDPGHLPRKEVYTKDIAGIYPIYLLSAIKRKLSAGPLEIEGQATLDQIKRDYNIEVDDERIARTFRSRYSEYKWFFKHLKPSFVFVVCSYYDMGKVKAAKDLGIKVVEIQHGSIGEGHEAYNIYADLDRVFYPDYVLAFGQRDVEILEHSGFVETGKVYALGSFYIDHLKKVFKPDKQLVDRLKNFEKVVGVTLQSTIEDELIDFVFTCAALDKGIGYVLIPRHPIERDYSDLVLPENVMVELEHEFYELMLYVDIHSTVYSSCAVEAPSLGAPNILININNLSKLYFSSLLRDERVSKYVETPEEFLEAVRSFNGMSREYVASLNEDIIKPGYLDNIKFFINSVVRPDRA